MTLRIEYDREVDGRWIADVVDLPGVMSYGRTQQDAYRAVVALAYRVLAERAEQGKLDNANVCFEST